MKDSDMMINEIGGSLSEAYKGGSIDAMKNLSK